MRYIMLTCVCVLIDVVVTGQVNPATPDRASAVAICRHSSADARVTASGVRR